MAATTGSFRAATAIEHVSRLYPFLTLMGRPEAYGTNATQLLLDRLSGLGSQRRRIVVLPADVIVRKSSGAPTSASAGAG